MAKLLKSLVLEPFGCEVEMDLSVPLTPECRAELNELYAQHLLLVFRRQQITPQDQVRVMGHLGPVLKLSADRSYEFVSNTRSNGKLGSDEITWHSDMQFSPKPFAALSLYALNVVDLKSSTRFSSGARAYDHLPDSLRSQLASLESLNVFASDFPGRNRSSTLSAEAPRSVHPVVMKHPRTGRSFLYTSWQQTDSIIGWEPSDSDKWLEQLFTMLYSPDNVLEHHWSVGDLVIWDNLAVQHREGTLPPQANGPS